MRLRAPLLPRVIPPSRSPDRPLTTWESLIGKPDTIPAAGLAVALSDLPPNASATREFLRSVSSATAWDILTAADVGAGTFGAGAFRFQNAVNAGASSLVIAPLTSNDNTIQAVPDTADGTIRRGQFYAIGYGRGGQFVALRSGGVPNAPTAVLTGVTIGAYQAGGYDATAWGASAQLRFDSTENWAVGKHGTKAVISTTAAGSAALADRLSIDENSVSPGASSQSIGSAGSPFGSSYVQTAYLVAGTQVLASRRAGWAAWTGTPTRTSQATYSGTASAAYVQAELQGVMNAAKQNSEGLKALLDDLIAHGVIGP